MNALCAVKRRAGGARWGAALSAAALCCLVAVMAGHELSAFGMHPVFRHYVAKFCLSVHTKSVDILNLAPHVERLEASLPYVDFAFGVEDKVARALEVIHLSGGLHANTLRLPIFVWAREINGHFLRTLAVQPASNSARGGLTSVLGFNGNGYWTKLVCFVRMPSSKDFEDIDIGPQLNLRALVGVPNQLTGGPPKERREDEQKEGKKGERHSAPGQPSIKFGFFAMLVFLMGSVACALRGGDALYEERRARCAAWAVGSLACGGIGFGVLLNVFPSGWWWWL